MSATDTGISRAYFNASAEGSEPTYAMLPLEHPDHARGKCGLLQKHMYGRRAGADGWQQEYSSSLKSIGLAQGEASPNIFVQKDKNIATSVHGDDLTSVGARCNLDWLEEALQKKYELRKGGRLGPGAEDASEIFIFKSSDHVDKHRDRIQG